MAFAWQMLYLPAVLLMVVLTGIMLIRAVQGPGTTDRILAVNMISTMVICIILLLSRLLDETWLLDVAMIYAMVSIVTITMLASLYVKRAVRSDSSDDAAAEEIKAEVVTAEEKNPDKEQPDPAGKEVMGGNEK